MKIKFDLALKRINIHYQLKYNQATIRANKCAVTYSLIPIHLTHCLLVPSADNLCKQLWPRSGPTKCRAWSGSKLFETMMLFLKELFEKDDFEKNQQMAKSMHIHPAGKELTAFECIFYNSIFLLMIWNNPFMLSNCGGYLTIGHDQTAPRKNSLI